MTDRQLAVQPSPANSRAILIGVSQYHHESMEALPAVEQNLASLSALLTDPDLWGLPAEHCVTLLNPRSSGEVMDAVHAAAAQASDGLLVYYAGHGLLDDRSDLYLALSHSDKQRLYHGIRYDDVRREVVHTARRCQGKVMIIDCCFSGRALLGGMSGPSEVVNHASIDGTYLITASAETSVALAPIGERYTAFTGALVENLANGILDGPDLLDMETLFFHIRARMQERNFPIPQQRARNDGRLIALVRNRRSSTSGGLVDTRPAARPLPALPEGTASMRPREISNRVNELRQDNDFAQAEALLTAAGARNHEQSVAALIEVLRSQERPTEIPLVIAGATLRPATEIVTLMHALRDTDLPDQAQALLHGVAIGSVEGCAAVAQQLQARRLTADLDAMLDIALIEGQRSRSMIELVNALWLSGLRGEVDQLLQRTADQLPDRDVLALADELRGAGRDQAAFGLYVTASAALARQPADTIARIVQEMAQAGHSGTPQVARAAIYACDDRASILAIYEAFRSAGQRDYADSVLHHAIGCLSDHDLVQVADQQLRLGYDEAALNLCNSAVSERSAEVIEMLVDTLREAGRPVDAKNLLGLAGMRLVLDQAFMLIASIASANRPPDMIKVLDGVARRSAPDIADITERLLDSDSTAPTIQPLLQAVTTIDEQTGEVMAALGRRSPHTAKVATTAVLEYLTGAAAAAILRSLPADDARAAFLVALQNGEPLLGRIVQGLRASAESANEPDPILALLHGHPRDQTQPLLAALRGSSLEEYAQALSVVSLSTPGSIDELAHAIAELVTVGDAAGVDKMLLDMLPNRSALELRDLIVTLHRQHLSSALNAVLAAIRTNCDSTTVKNLSAMFARGDLQQYGTKLARR